MVGKKLCTFIRRGTAVGQLFAGMEKIDWHAYTSVMCMYMHYIHGIRVFFHSMTDIVLPYYD